MLALEIDGRFLLPTDESGYGFDNIADVLSVSPGLLDRYMLAAQKISRLAVGDPTLQPVVERYTIDRALVQDERMSTDLPFGSRGGTVIRHYFSLDGEYGVRIRLTRSAFAPRILGIANREQLDVRLDGTRIKLFAVGGECVESAAARCMSPPDIRTVNAVSEYEQTADAGLAVRFPVKAGMRQVEIAFLKRAWAEPEGAAPARSPRGGVQGAEMEVDSVDIEGPFDAQRPEDTPSRRQVFVCHPTDDQDEESCATKTLARLARRAYRRPVTDQDVQTLLGFYRTGRRQGGFEAGIRFALERLLVSLEFLARIERDPANVALGAVYRISDLELASRLSFFLWSSIPDDELLDLAASGKLSDPEVLEQQVRRMLADTRSQALVDNFFGQWLYLRNMRGVTPDPNAFPEFDGNLRAAFERETELFLENQLHQDRSVVDLLTANYTFVNERLARLYGIPNVYGSHFRRVTLSGDNRAGLLGHGSILTVTSYATRTSPVLRGRWLLEKFLGAPPPPPPPNVPALKESGEAAQPTSVRERLEQHRKNPVCAGCHSRMDPLGFALENFNGIGKWRTSDANTPIDASGVFPDGTKFSGPAELRNMLLKYREELVRTVIEKLLTYALGRGVEYYDMPAVRAIRRDAAPDYRWSSVILGIAKSLPFQMRTAPASGPLADTSSRTRRLQEP